MKKSRVLSISILIAILLACTIGVIFLAACGDSSESDNLKDSSQSYEFVYSMNSSGDGYEILEAPGDCGDVVIPAEYNDMPVTAISARAFENSTVTSVVIPDSITNIGAYAFSNCKYLTSITIPDSVTNLGSYTFYNCYNLRQAVVGDGVERIGDYTFYECSSLRSVAIGKSVEVVGSYAFYDCLALNDVDFASSGNLTTIGERAFCNCSSLKSVVIPDSVTSMGSSCFSGCSSLENIVLPFVGAEKNALDASELTLFGYIFGTESYTGGVSVEQKYSSSESATYCIPNTLKAVAVSGGKIMYGAFYNCSSLTSVTIGEDVSSIESYAFYNCRCLTELNYDAASIGNFSQYNYIFYCAGVDGSGIDMTIGAAVKSIPAYLFYESSSSNSPNLISVTFESGCRCESIGSDAFYRCSALKRVYISDIDFWCGMSFADEYSNPLYYAGELYLNNKPAGDVTISAGAESVGKYAFYNCSTLTGISIPDSVTTLGSYAFYGCTALTSVTIGTGVTSISSYAFFSCSSLSSVTMTNGVKSIGSYAFQNCYSLASITIPNGVTSIGSNAFRNCTSMVSAAIPDSVVDMGSYAFYGCTDLASVTIGEGIEGIETYVFYGCTSLTNIYFGNSVTSIGNYAFRDCASLTALSIPDSIESIGTYAFYNCTSLEILTIGKGVKSIGTYAFYGCTGLTEINYNAECLEDLSSGNDVFYNVGKDCAGTTVIIGANVTKIPACLFYSSTNSSYEANITSVIFAEGSQCGSIGGYAFNGCSALTGVYIYSIETWCEIEFANETANPLYYAGNLYVNGELFTDFVTSSDLTSIRAYAFCGCTSLERLTIGSGVESIGNYAFSNCRSLTEIRFDATSMSDLSSSNYSFRYAGTDGAGITVIIGANVTKIPAYLFGFSSSASYSPNIMSVVFEDGSVCTSIRTYAFANCISIADIDIPDSVTTIGSYAFYNCASLTSITISASVTTIGNYAFYYCTSLTEIHFDATNMDDLSSSNYTFRYAGSDGSGITVIIGAKVTKIPAYLFNPSSSTSASPNITSVIFEEGSICASIESYAFGYCGSLTSIVIPASMTSIASNAFRNCTDLASVYYHGTSDEWSKISVDSTNNSYLTNATIYYYSASAPTATGNWWHYDESGEIVVWGKED